MFDNKDFPELTMDEIGYVFWRGHNVEHYSFYGQDEKEQAAATELAARCRRIEELDLLLGAALSHWRWFETMPADSKWKSLLKGTPALYVRDGALAADFDFGVYRVDQGKFEPIVLTEEEPTWRNIEAAGWRTPDVGQGKHAGICFATYEQLVSLFETYAVDPAIGVQVEVGLLTLPETVWIRYLTCTCCGGSVPDTEEGNVDFGKGSYDAGYGMCIKCGGDKKSDDPREYLGWAGRRFYEARMNVLSGSLNETNRAKFETLSYEQKVWLVNEAVKDGLFI